MSVKNWGASAAETSAAFPCDALGFEFDDVFHRAMDVAAPAPLAYRWLCQLRVAPYSYDLVDNFARRSPPRLTPGLEDLAIGQGVMTIFRVACFTAGSDLTIVLASRCGAAVMGDFAGSYCVRPTSPCTSRIVVRVLVRYPRGLYGRALRAVMPFLDLVMFRKQLLTLKRYAERDAAAPPGSQAAARAL